jgi:hypothetical protein
MDDGDDHGDSPEKKTNNGKRPSAKSTRNKLTGAKATERGNDPTKKMIYGMFTIIPSTH